MTRSERPGRLRLAHSSTLPTFAPFDERGPHVDDTAVRDRVRGFFSPQLLQAVAKSAGAGFRNRLLTIPRMLLTLLYFVVDCMPSFRDAVDRLSYGKIPGVRRIRVTASAFSLRLQVVPHTVFQALLQATTRALVTGQQYVREFVKNLAPFATEIYALDDTTLDALVRRTKALQEHAKGAMETLAGRLGCALDLTTGKFAEVLYDPDSKANEKTHARPLVERLSAGSLYVFDLGYFSFPFLDFLSEHFCYFVSRLRKGTSYTVLRTLAEGPYYRDRLVWLGKHRADRAAHPVRLVELLIRGRWYSYVTNVWNTAMLPAPQIWALYAQRWTIEMAFAAVKRALGLAFLHPTHQNGILIQIWSTLAIYQVLQDLRLEIAARSGWHEDDVSWTMLMRRIAWYVQDPEPDATLREWLATEAADLHLRKRGVRQRRLRNLPAEVLAACDPPPTFPYLTEVYVRTPRQGDRRHAKKTRPVVLGGLT